MKNIGLLRGYSEAGTWFQSRLHRVRILSNQGLLPSHSDRAHQHLLLSATYPSAAKHLIYRRPPDVHCILYSFNTPAYTTYPHIHFSRQASAIVSSVLFSPYSPRPWRHTGPENEHPRCDVRSGTSAACNTLPKISSRQR